MQKKALQIALLLIWMGTILIAAVAAPEEPVKVATEKMKLLKKVNPQYPMAALQAGIQGLVVIEAIAGTDGRVTNTKLISGHPMLNEAAVTAVKQWEYAPLIIDGKAKPVQFTVTVSFTLQGDKKPAEKDQPKLLKKVDPTYPEEALKNKVQSVVILEVTTDTQGKVSKVKVVSGHPLFNESAIEAVKQWEYEPLMKDGKTVTVTFTVTVQFRLK